MPRRVCGGERAAHLRRMHDRRKKHHVLVEQRIQTEAAAVLHHAVPGGDGVFGHGGLLLGFVCRRPGSLLLGLVSNGVSVIRHAP